MTVQTHRGQQSSKALTIVDTIRSHANLIAEALPKHLDSDRFARLALTTLRKDPALQRCNPESFVGSLLTAAALGLEPGVNGEAYLVAYKGECTLIVGYQGIAKLFWQHPLAARLTTEYVCANDHFEYELGSNPHIDHRPAIGDRGRVIAYYAIVGLKNGAEWFGVFTPKQITALRGPARNGGIPDPEHWMERKTALKQVLKLAPKATALHQVQAIDEKPGSIKAVRQIVDTRQQLPQPEQQPEGEQVPDNVDPETGQIFDGEVVADGEDPWADGGAA